MSKTINVASEINGTSALTQEQGDIIYKEIVNSFEKREKIILDFNAIESMISPFLNNAIGQLYEKYTSDEIKALLELKGFPESKTSTLNIVISNAKKFYANKDAFRKTAKDVLNIE